MRRLGLLGSVFRRDPVHDILTSGVCCILRRRGHRGGVRGDLLRLGGDRIVFTYQNVDGRGWEAIARALARSGVIPFCTFPLLGDSSISLHKHAHSISWDCIMVCRIGERIKNFQIGPRRRGLNRRFERVRCAHEGSDRVWEGPPAVAL